MSLMVLDNHLDMYTGVTSDNRTIGIDPDIMLETIIDCMKAKEDISWILNADYWKFHENTVSIPNHDFGYSLEECLKHSSKAVQYHYGDKIFLIVERKKTRAKNKLLFTCHNLIDSTIIDEFLTSDIPTLQAYIFANVNTNCDYSVLAHWNTYQDKQERID